MTSAPGNGQRQYNHWDRARLSVVVPVGVIVTVAILCIIVAVLSSAQRADDISVANEQQTFARAITSYGQRILRELESVTSYERADTGLRQRADSDWTPNHFGPTLDTYFDHDFTFLLNANSDIVYTHSRWRRSDALWNVLARKDLDSTLHKLESGLTADDRHSAIVVARFLGQPAIIAAVVARESETDTAGEKNTAVTVKVIGQDVLDNIASDLRIRNLRQVDDTDGAKGDFVYRLNNDKHETIAYFAWTPNQPGAEIVSNVIPFLATALAGFALLAAFVLRYMRRTAAAIVAGERRLHHLAMHDPLCGLPNRALFSERLEQMIETVKSGGKPAVLFYIDLDHFKDVNDTLGHHVGDELIRNVTLRLSKVMRSDDRRSRDLVARLGGDEFAILSAAKSNADTIVSMANRILAAVCAPYAIGNHTIVIGASIGIAVIDSKQADATDIMRYADMALYRAKNEGRNRFCIYDAAMDAELSSRKLMEVDLRDALEREALALLYQPLMNGAGDKMIGVEALCRWTHPVRGSVPPSEFIPVAEHSGLINELGEWVLRRACLDAKAWPSLSVAVNVSPLQFRRTDFVDVVERVLTETGFDATRLELELTEGTLLGNFEIAELAMRRLRNIGVRLALDDFGTGYSSLQYLRKFPFDKLKIDRSFVDNIDKAADSAAIVHAIVSLGRGLGMRVTAEGVETADQHLFLRAAGVHCMQGFRFGAAVAASEISARLLREETGAAALAS